MGSRIYSLADQLLAQVCVPVVFYLIIRPARNSSRNQSPPVPEKSVEAENEILFIGGDLAAFDGRAEVVHPAEATALAAAEETGSLREGAPPAFSFFLDVIGQNLVFLRRPWPPLQSNLDAAWCF